MGSCSSERRSSRVRVFYDGACPVCRREIGHYRRLDPSARIDWCDIAADASVLAEHGLSLEQAMRRFHVVDPAGRLRSGADAFTVIWAQLPGWRWLARAVRALRLTPLLERAYALWAERRWRRLQRCGIGSGRA
jgi:predicted DCC family thiol-disulfide oxidoreductase YuxK